MLFSQQILELIRNGIGETLCMVIISTVISYMIGIPLGIILVVTDKEGCTAEGAGTYHQPAPVGALPYSSDHDDPGYQKAGGNQPGLEGSGAATGGICSTLYCPHGRILL